MNTAINLVERRKRDRIMRRESLMNPRTELASMNDKAATDYMMELLK
jgi:hypothetical protein